MLKLATFCVALVAAWAAGGWTDMDTSSGKVDELVDFAATTLNAMSNSILLSKPTSIVKAQQQLVNGHNYKIQFVFGLSKCNKYSNAEQLDVCDMYTDRDQMCDVVIYESFTNEKMLKDFKCKQKSSSSKRGLEAHVTGGVHETLELTQGLQDVAMRALSMSNAVLTEVKLTSARTQVVSGMTYYLTVEGKENGKPRECKMEVWVRTWIVGSDGFQTLGFKCRDKPTASKLDKRAGGMISQAEPTKFMNQAMRGLAMSNAFLKNIKILSARTQVVAGEKIMLELVGDSLDGKIKNTKCDMHIWSRPWLRDSSSFIVTKFDCNKKLTSKRRLGGGIKEEQDLNQDLQDIALRAVSMSNADLTGIKLTRARTQVVAGMKYYLTIEGNELGQDRKCELEVWVRPWLIGSQGFNVQKFDCNDKQSKRAIGGPCAGCVSEEVKNPEDYMELYIRAFGQANTNLDINNIKILSVKTQVVAGIKYIMKVETTEAGEPRICDVTFVDAPWMGKLVNVNFDCKPNQ